MSNTYGAPDPRVNYLGLQVQQAPQQNLGDVIAYLKRQHQADRQQQQGPIRSWTQVAAGILDTAADKIQDNRILGGMQSGNQDVTAALAPSPSPGQPDGADTHAPPSASDTQQATQVVGPTAEAASPDAWNRAMDISTKAETGKNGLAALNNISPDAGGSKSYGPWGLNSKTGSAAQFATAYPKLGLTAQPGTPEFDGQWLTAAKSQPEAMVAAHQDWHSRNIARGISVPALNAGIDPAVANSPQVQSFLMDRKLQMGSVGLDRSLAAARGSASPQEFIARVGASDRSNIPSDFRTYLRDHPNDVQGLSNRIDTRTRVALLPFGGQAAPGASPASTFPGSAAPTAGPSPGAPAPSVAGQVAGPGAPSGQTSAPSAAPTSASAAPASPGPAPAPGAPAASPAPQAGGQIIPPQFLRPKMSPDQQAAARRALNNPFVPQHQKDQIIQRLQAEQQPYSVPHPSGNGTVMIDPRTGAQQHIPAHADEYKEIGKDAFGNPNYGFVNPYTHQVTPAKPGGTQGGFDTNNVNWDLSGEDFLNQFPKNIQTQVHAYVEGRQMPTGNPRSGNVAMVKSIAQKYGDDTGMQADDTFFNARKTMRNGLSQATPGSLGGQINAGNTAIIHLADLSEAAAKLGNMNLGTSWLSHPANTIKNTFGDNSAKVLAMQEVARKYGEEVTKFYAGSSGGVEERMRAMQALNTANTPKELAAVIAQETTLMQGKLGALETQIRNTLGQGHLDKNPVVSADSKNALDRIGGNVSTLSGVGPAPEASTGGRPSTPSSFPVLQGLQQGQQEGGALIDEAIKKHNPNYKPPENMPTFVPFPAMGPGGSALPGAASRAAPFRPIQGPGNPNAMPPGAPPAAANHGSFRDWAKGAATFQGAETLKSVIQHLLGF